MTAGCTNKQKGDGQPPSTTSATGINTSGTNTNNKPQKPKDVFGELGYEAAYVLALKAKVSNLQNRVQALEKHRHEEKIKQNKFVLRELVKEARARILEVNGILPPSSRQSWKYCLHNLTPQQLQQANVNLRLWPEIVEILSPSAVKLNNWVHGYTSWQAARVIEGMNSNVQPTWAALFKMTHKGESFEDYTNLEEPTMAEELREHE
jgi:hypothetical protein